MRIDESPPSSPVPFDAFVRLEFGPILALGLAVLHDRDDALDVAQETMARAHERWAVVGVMDRPGAWTRRVALNLITDVQRRRTRRVRLLTRLRDQPHPAADTTAPELWDRAFWERVAALPQRQRDVVVLHYVHDLSVAEIAEVVEAPDGTVKSDLSRARSRLRAELDGSDS